MCCDQTGTTQAQRATLLLDEIDPATVDGNSGLVNGRGGARARLTPLELRVLWMLMCNSRRYVPPAELSAHVWQFGEWAESSVVHTTMHRLRRKLKTVQLDSLIDCQRQYGYRVVCRVTFD